MKPSFLHRVDLFARHLTPFALTLVLVILNVVPTHVPGISRVLPVLALMAIYHWSIHRPTLMPAYAVFLIGIMQDGLTGTPLGLHAVVFLAVQGVVLFQHTFFINRSFFIVWLGFALVAAGAQGLTWLLMSAYHVTVIAPDAMIHQYIATLGFFPLLAFFFTRWQNAFLKQD